MLGSKKQERDQKSNAGEESVAGMALEDGRHVEMRPERRVPRVSRRRGTGEDGGGRKEK